MPERSPLVEVGAAEEDQDLLAADGQRADGADVADRGGRDETSQVVERDLGVGLADLVGGRCPARPQHQRHVVLADAGRFGQRRGSGRGEELGARRVCRHRHG
jgi:hypothetical protein